MRAKRRANDRYLKAEETHAKALSRRIDDEHAPFAKAFDVFVMGWAEKEMRWAERDMDKAAKEIAACL